MYTEIEDLKLHYQVVGEGKPVIILHGFFGISDGMMEIFEPIFSKHDSFKRIYLDSPGNGKSDAPDWMNSSDLVLKAVESFIDQVIGDEKFLLVGYSYGGYLSTGLIHRRASQIEGVLLLCPLVEPDESLRHIPSFEMRKTDEDYLKTLDPGVQEGLKAGGAVVMTPSVFQRSDKVYSPAFVVANEQFLNRLRSDGYSFSFDIYDFPSPYGRPALILTGRQDKSVGYGDAMKLQSEFTRATFVVLDAAGHGLPLEQDSVFTSLVSEWLERIAWFERDMVINMQPEHNES